MAERDSEYIRLPGKGRKGGFFSGLAGSTTLYLGKDHLLAIESAGYEEEYKRFYYRDIQAIVLWRTGRYAVWNYIWGGLTVICLLLFLTLGSSAAAIPLAITGGVFGVLLAIHVSRGVTVQCQLRTAVQVETLTSLNRLRHAQKALGLIKPLLEQAQGQLAAEQLPELVATVPQVAAPESVGKRKAKSRQMHYAGRAHEALCYFMLLWGLFNVIDAMYADAALQIFDQLFSAGMLFSAMVAMFKQHNSDMPTALRRIVWLSVGFICTYFYVCLIGASIAYVAGSGRSGNELSAYMKFTGLIAVDIITTICMLPAGLVGLLLLSNFRQQARTRTTLETAAQPQIQPVPEMPQEAPHGESSSTTVH